MIVRINHVFLKIQLLFCLLISTHCYGQQSKITLINKDNSWRENIFCSYYIPLSTMSRTFHEMILSHELDTSKYVLEISTREPLFFNFSWNFKFHFFWLFPGDTLEFRTLNDTIPKQLRGSRPDSELSFYSLLEANQLGYLSSGTDRLEITNRLNFQYVADQSLERHRARLKFLDEQLVKEKYSDQGRSVITQSLYYQYLNELLFPYKSWEPIEVSFENNIIVPDSYKTKLRELAGELKADSLIYLFDYKRLILKYARFLMLEATKTHKADLSSLLSFHQRTFSGKIRDCLLFDEIYQDFQRTGEVYDVPEVIQSIENKSMRDALISLQKKTQKGFSQLALGTELQTPSGENYSLKQVLTKYPQKLIYIDFWATWCGPCLMEMPDSEKLTQQYRNDNIEFIYLSIDQDKQKWLRKIASLPNGGNAHHYRMSDAKIFMKEMGIEAVPRYILIGKDGRMISSFAPRPRSIEIRELITNNLKIRK